MFFTYTFFNVIILHFTNVQHVLDRVLIEKSRKSYLCLITKLHLTNVQHVLDRVLTEKSTKSYLCSITKLAKMVKTIIFLSHCVSDLLFQCGDNEVNPGPKYSCLIFCYWNLNDLTAHDNIRISLLQAHVTQ